MNAQTTYTTLTVSSRTTRVTHLWVGGGNLCGVEFTQAPNVRQLQQNTICVKCAAHQDEYDTAQEAAAADRVRIMNTHRARRLTAGQAVVTGWEVLYDKPRKHQQIGRRDGQYALICTTHKHVHPLRRLVDERELNRVGGWCSGCAEDE